MTRLAHRQRFLVCTRFAVTVVDVVSRFFGIPAETIRGPARDQATCRARMISMFLLRGATSMSYPEIGRLFNGRDHTTVIHALKAVETWLVRDPDLRLDLIEIACAVAARTRPATISAPTPLLQMLPARPPERAEEPLDESSRRSAQ